jgi:soluble lytic murein transglycosylase
MSFTRKSHSGAVVWVLIAGLLFFAVLFVREGRCNGGERRDTALKGIAKVIVERRAALTESRAQALARSIYDESAKHGVDYRLILAIVKVESNFKPDATSKDGARGLMQIKPSLAKGIAKKTGGSFKGPKDLHEPDRNVKYGTYHVAKLMEDYENVNAALHVYNVGIKGAEKRLSREDEPDTPFINRVLKEYYKYSAILPEP